MNATSNQSPETAPGTPNTAPSTGNTAPDAAPNTAPSTAPDTAPDTAIEQLKRRIPDHARDLRINLGVIGAATALSPHQAWGTAVAAAITSRNPEVIAAIEEAAAPHLPPQALTAARAAASIMAMNNIYYRFVHMIGDDSLYGEMPARLRMQVIARPGVDALDFELWCLAASAITGCEKCVRAHEASVRERQGTAEHVHEAVRIAAVVHAVAITLDAAPDPLH